jgi:ribosomal protein S18 acetylase RimI-like enzyme
MAVVYTNSLAGVTPEHLVGFFVGWPNPPGPETHLRLLRGSDHVWLARETETGQVVGFMNALSDGVLSAFIPLLEVLPAYQGRGIGSELARRMLASLTDLYAVDLMCDPDLQPFYARLGGRPAGGVVWRRYDRQSGA